MEPYTPAESHFAEAMDLQIFFGDRNLDVNVLQDVGNVNRFFRMVILDQKKEPEEHQENHFVLSYKLETYYSLNSRRKLNRVGFREKMRIREDYYSVHCSTQESYYQEPSTSNIIQK